MTTSDNYLAHLTWKSFAVNLSSKGIFLKKLLLFFFYLSLLSFLCLQRRLQGPGDVPGQGPGWKLVEVEERNPPRGDGQHDHGHSDEVHPEARLHLEEEERI